MQKLADFRGRIRDYFVFSPLELRNYFFSLLAISFIVSFNEWGEGQFNVLVGLKNLLNSAVIVLLVFLVCSSVQRLVGLYLGYRVEYRMWLLGMLLGLAVIFVSKGSIWVILPGGILIHHLAGHRLGIHRYGMDYYTLGLVSYSGTLALLVFAFVFKTLSSFFLNPVINKLIFFSLIFIIYDMLPIPPMTGSKLFFGSRLVYIFTLAFTLTCVILLFTDTSPLITGATGIIIAVVAWFAYYLGIERKIWKGPYSYGWAPKSKK